MRTNIFKMVILSLLVTSCELSDSSAQYTYHYPDSLSDGLEVGTIEEVSINPDMISEILGRISQGKYGEIHSLLIYKDSKLVVEEYFEGHRYKWDAPGHYGEWISWDSSTLHGIKSVSKSITSACVGIAIDNGFIESVHQSIFEYLPDHQHLNKGGKDKISIEHLLTMTSGLEWDEWGAPLSSAANDMVGIWYQDKDPIPFILGRPLLHEPGSSFTYSGGNTAILGEIIKNASNMELDRFSEEYLFKPLGIDSSNWAVRYDNGVIEASGSLELTPRDMLKIGVSFLDNGLWHGERIVSEHWVRKSAREYRGNHGINIPGVASGRQGYSYSWWTKEYMHAGTKDSMYDAGGWGGQNIMVLPGLNMVVVFTGGNYTAKTKTHELLERFIIPANQ